MICGYAKRNLNDRGEMELREVSFSLPPSKLREIARFLLHASEEMEKVGDRPNYHLHIDNYIGDWRQRNAELDIVVVLPDGGT